MHWFALPDQIIFVGVSRRQCSGHCSLPHCSVSHVRSFRSVVQAPTSTLQCVRCIAVLLLYCCRLWPACDAPAPWQGVVRQLYGHLPSRKLLWTAADGGRWLSTQQCLFPDAACMQQDAGAIAGGSQAGASSSSEQQGQGVGSAAGSGSEGEHGGEGFGPLGEALVQLGLPLAVLPSSVLKMMMKYLVRSCLGSSCCCLRASATCRSLRRARGMSSSSSCGCLRTSCKCHVQVSPCNIAAHCSAACCWTWHVAVFRLF